MFCVLYVCLLKKTNKTMKDRKRPLILAVNPLRHKVSHACWKPQQCYWISWWQRFGQGSSGFETGTSVLIQISWHPDLMENSSSEVDLLTKSGHSIAWRGWVWGALLWLQRYKLFITSSIRGVERKRRQVPLKQAAKRRNFSWFIAAEHYFELPCINTSSSPHKDYWVFHIQLAT